MSTWLDLVDNATFVGRVFGGAPSLADVELHEVTLHRDGPVLTLRFDLSVFPSVRPRDWSEHDEVAQMTFSVSGVKSVRLEGWSTTVRGDLSVERLEDGDLRVRFEGPEARLDCTTTHVRVTRLAPHALSRDP